MSSDVQILNNGELLNRLRLVLDKLDACKLLISYAPELPDDPMLTKLFTDIVGAHVSCVSIIREKETPGGNQQNPTP